MDKGGEKRADVGSSGYLRPGLPHTSAFFMRRVDFRHDTSRRNSGNMACYYTFFCLTIFTVFKFMSGCKKYVRFPNVKALCAEEYEVIS